LKSRDNKFLATSKDIEDLRAQQKNSVLLAEATGLRSEGSRRQFAAFAKVKTGISDARRLLQNHDILGALGVLETAEKVTDIRLDVIKRGDSVPGDGWEAAGSYENRMLGDADAKGDKQWEASLADVLAKKKQKEAVKSSEGNSNQFYGRKPYGTSSFGVSHYGGRYSGSPFRGIYRSI
jgi:hypothetical protein